MLSSASRVTVQRGRRREAHAYGQGSSGAMLKHSHPCDYAVTSQALPGPLRRAGALVVWGCVRHASYVHASYAAEVTRGRLGLGQAQPSSGPVRSRLCCLRGRHANRAEFHEGDVSRR